MKVEKLIPEVYYSQSRDFSYIGRLMEILFNYMKTAADCVSVNPDSLNIDPTTIELIALTLGFESKHVYTTRDLIYIISSFSHLINKKGTKESINHAIKLLINSQQIKMDLLEDEDFILMSDDYVLEIKIPSQMTDTILLEDLFDYILPTGMLYRFNRISPQAKNKSIVNFSVDQEPEYTSTYDTSFIMSHDNSYSYILLTEKPSNWSTNYSDYYIYDGVSGKFVENTDQTYVGDKFFSIKENDDIGTIITGTVAES